MRVASIAVGDRPGVPGGRRRSGRHAVVGGGSFNTAPLLKPGQYSDTVAAGETVYWKVAMAKGQILRVKAHRRHLGGRDRPDQERLPRRARQPRLRGRALHAVARAAERRVRLGRRDRRALGRRRGRREDRRGGGPAGARLRADPRAATTASRSSPLPAKLVRLAERRRLGHLPGRAPRRAAGRARRDRRGHGGAVERRLRRQARRPDAGADRQRPRTDDGAARGQTPARAIRRSRSRSWRSSPCSAASGWARSPRGCWSVREGPDHQRHASEAWRARHLAAGSR